MQLELMCKAAIQKGLSIKSCASRQRHTLNQNKNKISGESVDNTRKFQGKTK